MLHYNPNYMNLFSGFSRTVFIAVIFIMILASATVTKAQTTITSPEDFFGFQMGTDRKLARWDRIVEYFYKLEQQVTTEGGYTYLQSTVHRHIRNKRIVGGGA